MLFLLISTNYLLYYSAKKVYLPTPNTNNSKMQVGFTPRSLDLRISYDFDLFEIQTFNVIAAWSSFEQKIFLKP